MAAAHAPKESDNRSSASSQGQASGRRDLVGKPSRVELLNTGTLREIIKRPWIRSEEHRAPSKAGRNLPAAIAVAVVLIATLLVGLFLFPFVLALLAGTAAGIGVWEIARSLSYRGIAIPRIPAVIAALLMPLAAYQGGAQYLSFAVMLSVTLVVVWRAFGPRQGMLLSIMGSVFGLVWASLLLSTALLLYHSENGSLKILTVVLLAVSSDTFGYAVGVVWGKHPMAPRISPKKSWEGFAGSLGGAVIVGILCSVFLLGDTWWQGAILAAAIVAVATLGDFSESMVKRELGIKDMGTLLPGHGGVMDRIDSILFAVITGYVLFELFAVLA
ncbi:phosphatidate cytidylyltransferase [Kocuria sp. cx-455]|uniref:phosphatidate cytidylyltransferase n=1 Tax=unclassified Candidatus Sulfotelmatobacter TaxID=2635724 RepID=UPI00168679D6|nr:MULTISPECIES: phosphatidate cytidylyltransferase [unclassified Candidatus Sulfotelmatobacter]MBD2762645.1 phosphatidate cytidylyltransferase [Kocuria sp. cx-116]MBD2765309.1 phosphatidate cytidylyltransferase [Kocuria sp. cx-455]